MKGCALRLVLKQKENAPRKWPIMCMNCMQCNNKGQDCLEKYVGTVKCLERVVLNIKTFAEFSTLMLQKKKREKNRQQITSLPYNNVLTATCWPLVRSEKQEKPSNSHGATNSR